MVSTLGAVLLAPHVLKSKCFMTGSATAWVSWADRVGYGVLVSVSHACAIHVLLPVSRSGACTPGAPGLFRSQRLEHVCMRRRAARQQPGCDCTVRSKTHLCGADAATDCGGPSSTLAWSVILHFSNFAERSGIQFSTVETNLFTSLILDIAAHFSSIVRSRCLAISTVNFAVALCYVISTVGQLCLMYLVIAIFTYHARICVRIVIKVSAIRISLLPIEHRTIVACRARRNQHRDLFGSPRASRQG